LKALQIKTFLFTTYMIFAYVLSTNSIFIHFIGFDFNPSKLFVLLSFPFIIIYTKSFKTEKIDLFFLFFISISMIKFFLYWDIKIITSLSNFIVPYIFYNSIKPNIKYINIKYVIYIIIFFATMHALFGLLQFYTGDRDLLIVKEIQEWKIKYASNFFFNPFENLLLLPQGLYAYSSVLAISLIFPLFLLFSIYRYSNKFIFTFSFFILVLTIFLTFSRFEILSIFILVMFAILLIKHQNIIYHRYLIVYILMIITIVGYMYTTSDQLGTAQARIITLEKLAQIFINVKTFLFGLPDMTTFRDKFDMDVPHNMYIFIMSSYGIVASLFLITYIIFKTAQYIKLEISTRTTANKFKCIFNYILLFLLFLLTFRAFDYYILDGYENIFLFFYCFALLDISAKKPQGLKHAVYCNSSLQS